MFYFHPIRSKEPPTFNFTTLDSAKYFYKMATTTGPSCGEQGSKFSKQELSCFSGVHHKIIGWENWIVWTPTFFIIHKKIWNDNWTKIGSCLPTLRYQLLPRFHWSNSAQWESHFRDLSIFTGKRGRCISIWSSTFSFFFDRVLRFFTHSYTGQTLFWLKCSYDRGQ